VLKATYKDPRISSDRFLRTYKKEVVARRGVVVTDHPFASAVGVETLVRCGNALDAAVTSLFTLAIVEPMMVSIFGAGFIVFRECETGARKGRT
jgi:gamma-glutamyltranspeptidase/glutathione hydrolase